MMLASRVITAVLLQSVWGRPLLPPAAKNGGPGGRGGCPRSPPRRAGGAALPSGGARPAPRRPRRTVGRVVVAVAGVLPVGKQVVLHVRRDGGPERLQLLDGGGRGVGLVLRPHVSRVEPHVGQGVAAGAVALQVQRGVLEPL